MLTELPEEKINLTEVEEKILKKRTSGLSFCQLEGDDFKHGIDQLILKASAITGCQLPQTEFFADILTEEIIAFISEFGYGELTFDELVFAMRLNAKVNLKWPSGVDVEQIPFSGHSFNVDYYSKVLNNYIKLRVLLDRKLENFIDGY